jgi:CheY-like chemotaxis protein
VPDPLPGVEARRTGVRVLVVNDYPDNVESLAVLLRLYGHEVDTALGGRAALRAARLRRPDVVLLDVSMPGLDGCQVAGELRRLLGRGVCLIALTARDAPEDRRRCQEAGFDRLLVKPADPEAVVALLCDVGRALAPGG